MNNVNPLIKAIGDFTPKKMWYGFPPSLPSSEVKMEILPSMNTPWVRLENGQELPIEDLINWTIFPW